jgi:hypothetical protein
MPRGPRGEKRPADVISAADDAKHWRRRVEEARTLARKITDKNGKARMMRLAKQYEKLAERAEQRSRERRMELRHGRGH